MSQEEFLNPICSSIADLKSELQKSEEKLQELQIQKGKLKKNVEKTTTSNAQLQIKISKLEEDLSEQKIRETEVKEDIDRLSKLILQTKQTMEEKYAAMQEAELSIVTEVNIYEQECRNIVSMLKTLHQPENEDSNATSKVEIAALEREIASLEVAEKKLWESKYRQLPFDETRYVNEMLHMELTNLPNIY